MNGEIETVARLLREAKSVAVLTGSGVSAESGIPTFRDALSGLWSRFRPEELATPEAFEANPKLVWDWYEWRRDNVRRAQPNTAHFALADLQPKTPHFTLMTQNVDGLHQRAGSTEVIELHGNILRSKCFAEHIVLEDFDRSRSPPRCPRCGAYMRPDVVWFGEALPQTALNAAIEAAERCDLFFSIGTSALVYPAAELPHTARARGAKVVEINKDQTPLSALAHHALRGNAGELLSLLLKAAP